MRSMFVEIAYGVAAGSDQVRYEIMEINLDDLRSRGSYTYDPSTPPLLRNDPRLSLGNNVSIVSFTSSGYL